ncbi:Long-chain-fatty-acid--CoA ligase FadD15 [bacterium HR30]|nr:Long-chain-fatty-acid--CoA ligase FadD15 [bacterium HR30]
MSQAERADIDRKVAGQTVCTLFQDAVEKYPDLDALKWKTADGWQSSTWRQYRERVHALAAGLVKLGIQPGEFVAILASNRPEHYLVDLAALHAGAVPVTIYSTLAPPQIEYILNHCEAALFVAENPDVYGKLASIRSQLSKLRHIVVIDDAERITGDPTVHSLAAVEAQGDDAARKEVDRRWKAVKPEDLATLIYTSGTTGPPKGVMVTHYNVCWTAESLDRLFPRSPGMRHISYLPLAHIAERMAGYYLHLKGATTCYFCPNPQQLGDYLREVRPEFFFAVPRIWEKLHAGLVAAIEKLDEPQRSMVKHAIEVSLQKVRLEQRGEPVPPEIEEQAQNAAFITAMIRERVGLDAIKVASSGAAPIAPELIEWFCAIGVPIAEVYGQSEDTGPTSWNRPGAIKIGTVGQAIPGVEVKLAEDGELLVRGGNVTAGYYKEPELTRETFDADGWLHSGDIATIDEEGYIRIVDRKKEIIITAGGKNIAPSNIENMLKQKPLIGQACVIGDRRPFVSALIVLDPETTLAWAQQQDLPADLSVLAQHPKVQSVVQGYIEEVNQNLSQVERIKKFVIVPQEWTIDSGELTPTMKMKRRVIHEKYAHLIEQMYQG